MGMRIKANFFLILNFNNSSKIPSRPLLYDKLSFAPQMGTRNKAKSTYLYQILMTPLYYIPSLTTSPPYYKLSFAPQMDTRNKAKSPFYIKL